jgi:dTDP-3-amino-3,4,6-trideoxy-alpha-D-glucose transaminase
VTNDPSLAARIRRLRNGGQTDRHRHEEAGVNSRLDEIQAAVLRARLPRLPAWTERRRALAARYRRVLNDAQDVQPLAEQDAGHVYHLFVVRARDRTRVRATLASKGVETLIHYPVPVPHQPAFAGLAPSNCPIAVRACDEVLSLPLHPGLSDADVDAVAASIHRKD